LVEAGSANFAALLLSLTLLLSLALVATMGGCREQAPEPQAQIPAAQAGADEAAGAQALMTVVEAERTQAYTGYKRIVSGPRGTSRETRMRVLRQAGGRTVAEGDDGEGARRWSFGSRFPWVDDPELLLTNYTVEVVQGESPRVAWRETRRLLITGRVASRPSLDLLVDDELSVVLQHELRDHEGAIRHTGFFESIEFVAPADSDLVGAESLEEPSESDEDATVEGWTPLEISSPPTGFRRVSRKLLSCGSLCDYWSDGLAAFRVVQSEAADDPDDASGSPPGELRRDERAGATRLTGNLDGVRVIVEGNLAASEVEKIARALVRPR